MVAVNSLVKAKIRLSLEYAQITCKRNLRTNKLYIYILFFLGISYTHAQKIEVDPNVRFQKIEGWGTSLSWSMNIIGGWPQSELTSIYDEITSPNELNMNIFKYNIPGGDNHELHSPTNFYWYNTQYGYPNHFRWDSGDITTYKTSANSAYNWQANTNQRAVLQALMSRRNDEILEAISYSPPYWMTVSGCSGGKGGNQVAGSPPVEDNISPSRIPEYADFLTEIVKYYHDNLGITFKYISPLNEPTTDYWIYGGGQEGCKVSNAAQQLLITSVYNSIQAKGMAVYTSVNAADDTSIDQTYDNIKQYQSGGIISKIGKLSTHTYGGSKRSGVSDLAVANNLSLWQSEVGGGDAGYLDMSQGIILDLKKMHVSAWINWQVISTSPSWGLYTFDADGLNGLKSRTLTKQKSYYGHKQFSKYIKSGYQIIRSTDDGSLTALSPDNNELVLILINKTGTSINRTVDLTKFTTVGTTTAVVRTSPSQNTAELANFPITGKTFAYTLPAQSITTIVAPVTVKAPATVLADGIYKIRAKHSAKFMSVNGFSSSNDAIINQWTDNYDDNFKFKIEKVGFEFKIKPVFNNKYLTINQESMGNGASLIQYDEVGKDNQRFFIVPIENGLYKIVSKHSYLNLAVTGESVTDGATIVQWPDLDTDNFKWEFIAIGDGQCDLKPRPILNPK